jgi:hypothetical protein
MSPIILVIKSNQLIKDLNASTPLLFWTNFIRLERLENFVLKNFFGGLVCKVHFAQQGLDGVLIWQSNKGMGTYTLNLMLRLLSSAFTAN